MRNTKKLIIFLFSFLLMYSANGYDIKNIDVTDDKTINFSLNEKIELADKYNSSDLKVLEDLEVLSSSKSFEDKNKLIISLKKDIIQNYSYSILTLLWAEWNMDFKVWNDLNWVNIPNTANTWIKSITIIDKNKIEINFDKPLVWDEFEFKILREIPIDKVVKSQNWWITVSLLETLVVETNYMIVVISLKDNLWILLNFDEWIYDFKTPLELIKTSTWTLLSTQKDLSNMFKWKDSISLKEQDITWKLTETSTWKIIDEKMEKTQLENIALKAANTPDTWAETSILIIITLVINSIIFFRKRFIKI